MLVYKAEQCFGEQKEDCLQAGLSGESSQGQYLTAQYFTCPLKAHQLLLHPLHGAISLMEQSAGCGDVAAPHRVGLHSHTRMHTHPHTQNLHSACKMRQMSESLTLLSVLTSKHWWTHPEGPFIQNVVPICLPDGEAQTFHGREFHADRSDMTSFSILFPISPGTCSSSDS